MSTSQNAPSPPAQADSYATFHDRDARARLSGGGSNAAIYAMVQRALQTKGITGECLVDVGCGRGELYSYVQPLFRRYIGADVVRYEGFPPDAEFIQVDFDSGQIPLPEASADLVVAVETIEHLENPRAFVRQLVSLVRPGGWLLVTTPNQLSLLSLLTLVFRERFAAFQDVDYPAHLSALLEVDLLRIGQEVGLTELSIDYSQRGRIPRTPLFWPRLCSVAFPRKLSDNLLLMGRRPGSYFGHEPAEKPDTFGRFQ